MFDYLIRNAQILDGSGAPAVSGDVGISGGTIAAVGDLGDVPAHQIIDAAGRTLTPGFWTSTAMRTTPCFVPASALRSLPRASPRW